MYHRHDWLAALGLLVVLALFGQGCSGDEASDPSGAESATQAEVPGVVRIGFNLPMTGDIPKVGESAKNAAMMLAERVNAEGGLEVGGGRMPVEFVYVDNESKAESAVAIALRLIDQDKVHAIVGPQQSKQAVPAGEACNANETPMIAPWSTNPATTLDRPYVFRAPFLDSFQGPVLARFATKELGVTKAAVLYDIGSDYPKGLAEFFKAAWEDSHGEGSVVAFETFSTKDQNFSAQLTRIVGSGAEVLFVPQYYSEVGLIVNQAHELGFEGVILGSDSWSSPELMPLCGERCKGLFFVTHFTPEVATGQTKAFVESYEARYGMKPDDVAALTWDSTRVVLEAVRKAGLTGDLDADRAAIRDAMAETEGFEGITGTITFDEQGDVMKCALIVKISETGSFDFHTSVCP